MPTNIGSDQNFTFSQVDFYGIIKIKGITVLNTNIQNLVVRESVFNMIPTLEMVISDGGLFSQQYALEDGDVIEVVLAKSPVTEQVVNARFILNDYSIVNNDGDTMQNSTISLTAYLESSDFMFPVRTRAFRSRSSIEVMEQIAKESGFTFNSKVKTNDVMTWRQISQTNLQMSFEVLKKAYIQNDGVMAAINRNGKMIVSSVNTAQKAKKAKKAIFSPEKTISNVTESDETIFYNNYSILNVMGTTNKTGGYGIKFGVYDLEKVKFYTLETNDKLITKYLYKNKENKNKPSVNNGLYEQDSNNVHKNYLIAKNQNEYFLNDFFKDSIALYISPTNSIDLFDLVDVVFPDVQNANSINTAQSGKYVVGGIIHSASKDGYMRAMLILFRNGYNQSSQIKNGQYSGI